MNSGHNNVLEGNIIKLSNKKGINNYFFSNNNLKIKNYAFFY